MPNSIRRHRARAALLPLLCAALLISCGEDPAPLRQRLFDYMLEARVLGGEEIEGAGSAGSSAVFDFDSGLPDGLGFALAQGRRLDYGVEPGETLAIEDGSLRLGPGLADNSRALLLLPAAPMARLTLRGRVRLENNPQAGESSSREVLRIYEYGHAVDDLAELTGRERARARRHRISRRLEPADWDLIEEQWITQPGTLALELQLLHRSGMSAEAVTRFDELSIELQPLGPDEIYGDIAERYRPRDGREAQTPWRLRVELDDVTGRRSEMRDAVLLHPPRTLEISVRLPAAETAPLLRFHCGLAPEAFRGAGDGARLEVAFVDEAGERTPLETLVLERQEGQRSPRWREARIDLSPVAGRRGALAFAALDVEQAQEQDPGGFDLDAILLANPRIEPAPTGEGDASSVNLSPPAMNVLLIGVDTLRADRMSAFGYGRPTTPHLVELADAGVRFAGTRSQAPWTLPSFSSILTSLYPSSHGAGRGGHDEWTPIDPTTTALAEVLAGLGWQTQGLVANGLISPHYGLDQGFEAYASTWAMESAAEDAPAAAAFVEEHTATPWLLFWHIMDPHLPYRTATEYREAFTDVDYAGRFSRGRTPSVPFEVLDPRPGRRWFTHEGPPPPPDLEEADLRFLNDYYDAELAEMDAAVGRVLEALRKSGQWERTIVAFVADHGEGLGDHDHYHHGYTLYDDQVHIPMILRVPGRHEGRVIERPVASIDLAPTILGALGIAPPEEFQGVDRLASDAPADDPFFIEYPTYDSSAQKAWIRGNYKYLHDPVFHTEALYDLEADPGERYDVADRHPELVARARAELDEFRWRELQKGRYHLRLRGRAGQRLSLRIETDDLFDANFVTRPQVPEQHFEMDLERRTLSLETELAEETLELVFWCRGRQLELALALDGQPLPGGLTLGDEEDPLAGAELALARDAIPEHEGRALGWPPADAGLLWLEAGAAPVVPVVLTPEQIEHLEALGYTR